MTQKTEIIKRPPVVVILGHIDHGKSTLLDYIRKTNVTAQETGGITQTISAYELEHRDKDGKVHRLTFIDTPGHEAFEKMREIGAKIADIAVLIVSAEEGVKAQTLEAYKTIASRELPCIVALNKIDRPGANLDRVRQQLAENSIFIEGYGGKIPAVNISAKTGEGVEELLDLLMLTAELSEWRADLKKNARGFILEAGLNPKTGISATLVVKDGRLWDGDLITVGEKICKVRRLHNFLGQPIKIAPPGTPVQLSCLEELPPVGAEFHSFNTKTEARAFVEKHPPAKKESAKKESDGAAEKKELALLIKVGLLGAADAVSREINRLATDGINPKIIAAGTGRITENDIKLASAGENPAIVIGFQTKTEKAAELAAERLGISIINFDIIYKMSEWLAEELKKREPAAEPTEEAIGRAKILKIFRTEKNKQIVGGIVAEGQAAAGKNFKIIRRQNEVGRGEIVELQEQKLKVKEVETNKNFGALIETKTPVAEGDILEIFDLVAK